ncbi:MAG: hypothetical protein KJ749_14515 [Planctomycetes bacterium]|nr:hypothetical protein [Planctomycetota bacterium]
MLTAIGQYVGGRIVTAVLVVASAGAVIWFWKHPEHLQAIWQIVKYGIAWLAFVIVLPWATFFVTPWVVARDSNLAAALMLIGYLLVDVLVAFWMIGSVSSHNALTWVVLLLGFLSAGIYNLKACEFQASRLEDG